MFLWYSFKFFGCSFQVKLDKLVNPNKAVVDYRTKITGICASDLDGVTCILADVQVLLDFFQVLSDFSKISFSLVSITEVHEQAVITWSYFSGSQFK